MPHETNYWQPNGGMYGTSLLNTMFRSCGTLAQFRTWEGASESSELAIHGNSTRHRMCSTAFTAIRHFTLFNLYARTRPGPLDMLYDAHQGYIAANEGCSTRYRSDPTLNTWTSINTH